MNDFQRKCIEVSQGILMEKGLKPCPFQEILGKTETYLMAAFDMFDYRYEIYVYDDEAGLMVDKDFSICEKPDFKSSQELIVAFSKILNEKLPHANAKKQMQ